MFVQVSQTKENKYGCNVYAVQWCASTYPILPQFQLLQVENIIRFNEIWILYQIYDILCECLTSLLYLEKPTA